MTTRILIAAIVIGATSLWIERQRPTDILLPDPPLADLSFELGEWAGEDRAVDERIEQAIGADELVQRSYRKEGSRSIGAHITAFTDYAEGLEHHPMSCYPAAGWRFERESPVDIKPPSEQSFAAKILWFEKNDVRSAVLYWYQLGDIPVFSKESLGIANLSLAGSRTRPALVKVMLSAGGQDREAVERDLCDFASHVLPFTLSACKVDR